MERQEENDLEVGISWAFSASAFLAAYFLTTALPLALAWYWPTEHRWTWELRPDGLAMDFYGRLLVCAAAAVLGGLAGRGCLRWMSEGARRRWVVIATAWSAALLLLVAGLYIHKLSGRIVTPAPLPPGHVAR